jgi:hypothetical protein
MFFFKSGFKLKSFGFISHSIKSFFITPEFSDNTKQPVVRRWTGKFLKNLSLNHYFYILNKNYMKQTIQNGFFFAFNLTNLITVQGDGIKWIKKSLKSYI